MDIGSRKRVGIYFIYDRAWLGGVYYLLNIIKAVNYLTDEEKPVLVILYNEKNEEYAETINYPYLEKHKVAVPSNPYVRYLYSWAFRRNDFAKNYIQDYKLDGLFPLHDFPVLSKGDNANLIAWYPDLQHKFFPEYFPSWKVKFRDARIKLMVKNAKKLVLSSKDVLSHFEQFFTLSKDVKVYLLPFVSILDEFVEMDAQEIKDKYKLPEKYFVVSNQLYPHKNHQVVLDALRILKEKGEAPTVVFTGKFNADKYQWLYQEVSNFIQENNLFEEVKIVGMISRNDQLNLIKHSSGLVQPSKFEGWSTVIEDGKSLQTQMIVSSINIHKEQLGDRGFFFDTDDPDKLANTLSQFMKDELQAKPVFDNYEERIQIFARRFLRAYLE